MTNRPRTIRALGLVALLPALLGVDLLQSRNRATEEGNARFKAGKAEEALAEYDKAAAKLPKDPGVQLNRGAALYSLSRFDEAAEAFLRATEAKEPARKATAFYDLGNSLYQAKKFKEAAAAFKKSLAYDSANTRAKRNLELALRKKADEEKNQDKNKDSKDDKGKEDQNKDNKDKQAQKDDKQDKDKGDNGKDKGDKPNSPKPNEPPQDKPPEPSEKDKQAQQDPAKEDPSKAPAQAQKPPEKPPEKPPGGQGQAQQPPDKDGKPTGDSREIEAILDNLERSPKSLEQELARLRAAQRRPPAKDW
jgi:Ca-activated chloride channel family protein